MEVEEEIGIDRGRDMIGESRGFLGITRDNPGLPQTVMSNDNCSRLGSLNTMVNSEDLQ